MVKISSTFVTFLENTNFNKTYWKQIGSGICFSKFQFPNFVFEMFVFFLDSYNVVRTMQSMGPVHWMGPDTYSMYVLCICVYSHINYSHGSLGDESQAQGAAFMYCAVIYFCRSHLETSQFRPSQKDQ